MNIDEQLKELLRKIQIPANENLVRIIEIKKKLINTQNFEKAIIINKIEKALLDFISTADTITKHSRTIKIKELFKTNNNMNQTLKEDFFDEEIKKNWGESATFDGITNIEEFQKAPVKILWILKEANNGDEENPILFYQREFHKDITKQNREGKNYPWWNTYSNILYASYGILHNEVFKDFNGMEDVDTKTATIDNEYVLSRIAFINVKKGSGGKSSNNSTIAKSYLDNKEALLQQIKGISPDVIINCSKVSELTVDLKNLNLFKLVLEKGHPMAKSPWQYVDDILNDFNSLYPKN
jgi:hypothetical protein